MHINASEHECKKARNIVQINIKLNAPLKEGRKQSSKGGTFGSEFLVPIIIK